MFIISIYSNILSYLLKYNITSVCNYKYTYDIQVKITLLKSKSILVRTALWCNGCGGLKLFPKGALGCLASPCISRLKACS